MKPDLVIFDCDGVLVDSESVTNTIFAEMLGELGLHLTLAEMYQEFVGLSFAECRRRIESRLAHPLPADFERDYDARTHAALAERVEPVRGVIDALASLDALGIATCVASSGSHDKMRVTLGRSGLLPRFEGRVFSTAQVPRGKPHPDIFLHAAAQFGAAPQRTIVIEDSIPGVRAGISAGMTVIGYVATNDPTLLAAAGATCTMRDMTALIDIVAQVTRTWDSRA